MKYKELIQFEPINEVVKFSRLEEEDYRKSLVRNFVFSKDYEKTIIPRICENLDYTQTYRPFQKDLFSGFDTFGLQIVGNYGTGKSHLMSLVSLIAENKDYLPLISNESAKEALGAIAGKYKIIRFELGNDQELWDIICYQIDKRLKDFGVNYSILADTSLDQYSVKLAKMMAHFEDKYPEHGLIIIIDEMLSYLKGRSEPGKLNRDLAVLQALGQYSDHSKFRMIFGVQEQIYNAPEFQFAAEMLQKVNDRYIDITITKQDVQYVVQHRLLKKTDGQKEQIRQHLAKYVEFFTDLHSNFEEYVELYPVNPSYFDNFSQIKIGKAQREVLKTLTQKFQSILDDEVPSDAPGLICYDSYWNDLKASDMQTDPDIRRITEIMSTVHQKIDDNFTGIRARKAPLAKRIANACAIKILQDSLQKQNGVSSENLVDDLCYLDATCIDRSMLMDVIDTTAKQIITATQGQYFEKSETNQEYHLRIEGGVNYEQKVKDFASQMSDSIKDAHFFNFLVEYLPIEVEQYRREFKIFKHKIDWKSHKTMLDGYIFMGNPAERSTTHPEQNFYIYFMPIFNKEAMAHANEPDSIYVHLDKVSDEMKELIGLWAASEALIKSVDTSQKSFYMQLKKSYADKLKPVFEREFRDKTEIYYQGVIQNISPGMLVGGSKEQVISNIASALLEDYFCNQLPNYPKFTLLQQPLTSENIGNMLKGARQKIANPLLANRNSEAILAGLGLLHENKLSVENSIYANSLKQKLEEKGQGQVLNRDEIIYQFWESDYRSVDFHIDAAFEFLVLSTMVALGEIEIDYPGGKNINATNIKEIVDITPDYAYSFSHIKRPRGMNVPAVKELFLGITGKDMTSQLDNPESYAQLLHDAKLLATKVVTLDNKIKHGLMIDGKEVLSQADGNAMSIKFAALVGLCDRVQAYNSQAKMRNLPWSAEELQGVFSAKALISEAEKYLKFQEEFKIKISYLNQAIQYIADKDFESEIEAAINEVGEKAKYIGNDSVINAYKQKLDALADRYADWYVAEYDRLHINEFEFTKKSQIQHSDTKAVCDVAYAQDFLTVKAQYIEWERKMSMLTIKQSHVTKANVLNVPYQNFNPKSYQNQTLPKLEDLKNELDEIYNAIDKSLHEILTDQNLLNNAADALEDSEKKLVEKYKSEQTTAQNVEKIIKIIHKLHKGIKKIEITEQDIREVLNRPMTPEDAIKALTKMIKDKSFGANSDITRIILK